MSTDDRILRLENAMATLAEFSANYERRVARLEETYVMLVTLVRSHEERIDSANEGLDELRAAQAESEQKIAVLANAQIRAEDVTEKLRAAQAESEERIAALADAHIRTEDALASLTIKVDALTTKVDALTDIVRNGRGGHEAT